VLDVWTGVDGDRDLHGALAAEVVEARGWWMERNADDVTRWCEEALRQEPDGGAEAAVRWLGPRQHQKAIGPIVGRVMKLSKGRADPNLVVDALRTILSKFNPS
jgi:Asp-tRNA(Asn)/Glu-tRNA(Gln) amidotransferase B subunit